MKVLLVNPTRTGADSYSTPPLHLMYLKKALDAAPDCVCEILDANYEVNRKIGLESNITDGRAIGKKRETEGDLIERIANIDFDILGVGGIVTCYSFSERLINRLRRDDPKRMIIVGGGLGLPLKDLWFESGVDFLVEGDAETTVRDIVRSFPDRESIKRIRGIYHRDGGAWKGTSPELPLNLDYIKSPDWNDVDYEYFMDVQKRWVMHTLPRDLVSELENARLLPVVFTRGCPYNCTFCFHFNRLHRKHSIDYIIEYLAHLKRDFGVNFLQTWDDLIVADRKWFSDLCDALIATGPGVGIFMSGGKPDLMDTEILRKMKKARVMRISYGIESGSQAILDEMKKIATVEDNYNAVERTVSSGIFTHLNMVLGMPGETMETLAQTEDFLLNLQRRTGVAPGNVSFSFASAYPGTELFDYARRKGFVPDVREYIIGDRGVGDYHLDLCALGERRLKKFAEGVLLKMEFGYAVRKKNPKGYLRLFLFSIPRFIAKFYLPRIMTFFLKKIYRSCRNLKAWKKKSWP